MSQACNQELLAYVCAAGRAGLAHQKRRSDPVETASHVLAWPLATHSDVS